MPGPTTLVVAALLSSAASATGPQTIFIASDSTAANYGPDRYPQMGWGMVLHCALRPGVRVENRAVGGRSTRTFMGEGRLAAIARDIKAGDTLLIQFGHNDANRAKAERFVDAETGYRANLKSFIATARAKSAHPVLLTPVATRSFQKGRAIASFPAYSAATRSVAAETRTPLIDLEARTMAWVQRAGEERSKRYFLHYIPADKMPGFPNGIIDDTHFSELGARGVADIVAGELRRLKLPVSKQVRRERPGLRLTKPLGGPGCAPA